MAKDDWFTSLQANVKACVLVWSPSGDFEDKQGVRNIDSLHIGQDLELFRRCFWNRKSRVFSREPVAWVHSFRPLWIKNFFNKGTWSINDQVYKCLSNQEFRRQGWVRKLHGLHSPILHHPGFFLTYFC